MNKSIKYILIAVLVIAAVLLIVFNLAEIGSLIALATGGFAAFKSKLLNNSKNNLNEQMELVEQEHFVKREEWGRIKEEYDSKYQALQAKMEYIDYRTAKVSQEISDVDHAEATALANNRNLTEREILNRLNDL